jgi:hypothetical protein
MKTTNPMNYNNIGLGWNNGGGGGKTLSDCSVGSTVKLKINGVNTAFIVIQQGNPDSDVYDDTCNGTWLLMNNCMEIRALASDGEDTGYYPSEIDTYLKEYYKKYFPSDIQNFILPARVPYTTYQDDKTSVVSKSAMSSDYYTGLFLLSGEEVGFESTDDDYTAEGEQLPDEGSCLRYFASGNRSNRKATYGGENT